MIFERLLEDLKAYRKHLLLLIKNALYNVEVGQSRLNITQSLMELIRSWNNYGILKIHISLLL